jgi:transcription elongation factor Elf1
MEGLTMSYTTTIEDIQNLPHYHEYTCHNCGHKQKVYVLVIHRKCENCGVRSKLRRYAAFGSEVEDVIDIVLEWIGKGDELEQAMQRKREIDQLEE